MYKCRRNLGAIYDCQTGWAPSPFYPVISDETCLDNCIQLQWNCYNISKYRVACIATICGEPCKHDNTGSKAGDCRIAVSSNLIPPTEQAKKRCPLSSSSSSKPLMTCQFNLYAIYDCIEERWSQDSVSDGNPKCLTECYETEWNCQRGSTGKVICERKICLGGCDPINNCSTIKEQIGPNPDDDLAKAVCENYSVCIPENESCGESCQTSYAGIILPYNKKTGEILSCEELELKIQGKCETLAEANGRGLCSEGEFTYSYDEVRRVYRITCCLEGPSSSSSSSSSSTEEPSSSSSSAYVPPGGWLCYRFEDTLNAEDCSNPTNFSWHCTTTVMTEGCIDYNNGTSRRIVLQDTYTTGTECAEKCVSSSSSSFAWKQTCDDGCTDSGASAMSFISCDDAASNFATAHVSCDNICNGLGAATCNLRCTTSGIYTVFCCCSFP